MIAVIPHHKVRRLRYGNWPKTASNLGAVRCRLIIFSIDVVLFLSDFIDIKHPILDDNRIPWNAHHPLDKILGLVFRKSKDNHIPTLRKTQWNDGCPYKRQPNTIGEFAHQDMIANVQCGNHRSRRNFKCLNHKGANK